MKILVACDWFITPNMVSEIKDLEKYGNEVVIFENPILQSKEVFTEYMLKT